MTFRLMFIFLLLGLLGCSNFISPVKSTPEPTEYSFNYWLLNKIYLYEDELSSLPEDGDSVQVLYKTIKDPFTRYTPPSKSEATIIHINTSLIEGDVGMRYYSNSNLEHPIIITRVYPQSPSGRAGIPRFGNIIKANDIMLSGEKALSTYDSILNYSKNIDLLVSYKDDTTLYKLKKETIYAPTVFIDTLFNDSVNGYPGIIFITIEGFKLNTSDKEKGTLGELESYLKSAAGDNRVRVLDLRYNPGGHVSQCIAMADLFVSQGPLSTMKQRSLDIDGKTKYTSTTTMAKAGDPGETGKYLILGNQGSASCSEIFIAAVTETTDIPYIGTRTYGKGVGQTNFNTYANGLATITNFEFLTPKGNSYHGKGITPQYECDNILVENCAAQVANKLYKIKIPMQENTLAKRHPYFDDYQINSQSEGGAVVWDSSSTYLDAFKESHFQSTP